MCPLQQIETDVAIRAGATDRWMGMRDPTSGGCDVKSDPASAPRIYGIVAQDAPVVAVFRRGPTEWAHIGRWDLERGCYEPGAWLHGRLFPRRMTP